MNVEEMNTREKYNAMIQTIEEEIDSMVASLETGDGFGDVISNDDILQKAFKKGRNNYEDLVAKKVFEYMSGSDALGYVTERRIRACYKILTSKGVLSKEKALWLSGVGDSQFYVNFKKVFGMSPDKARKSSSENLVALPLSWDVISGDVKYEDGNIVNEREVRLGMDYNVFVKENKAKNLQKFYGFNDKEKELALFIANYNGLDYDKVFEYVYAYLWQKIDPPSTFVDEETDEENTIDAAKGYKVRSIDIDKDTISEECSKDLTNPEVIDLYFNKGLGFAEILVLFFMRALGKCKEKLIDLDKFEIETCLKNYYFLIKDWRYSYLYDHWDYSGVYESDWNFSSHIDSHYDEEMQNDTDKFRQIWKEIDEHPEYYKLSDKSKRIPYGCTSLNIKENFKNIMHRMWDHNFFEEDDVGYLESQKYKVQTYLDNFKLPDDLDAYVESLSISEVIKFLTSCFAYEYTLESVLAHKLESRVRSILFCQLNRLKQYEEIKKLLSKNAIDYEELTKETRYGNSGWLDWAFTIEMDPQKRKKYKKWYDIKEYDSKGFDKNGLDKDGYNINGLNPQGFSREGSRWGNDFRDIDGYNQKGLNRKGLTKDGGKYGSDGYDKNGYDENGLNRAGYTILGSRFGTNNRDKDGYDRNGRDKNGRTRFENGDL